MIFSQSSDVLEHQSSMASSMEEVSGAPQQDQSGDSKLDDNDSPEANFTVFRDFDFLEYELGSMEVNDQTLIWKFVYSWENFWLT